ncbi:MAG: hypothetical protein JXA13_07845 [Anaerolineales bacterium]|nr:hypothetical protein [Anaerolineales bacterium]
MKIWSWIVGLGAGWGLLAMLLLSLADPTPENLTLTASIWTAGGYTLMLYAARRWWLPFLSGTPLRNAALLGIFNAAVVETEFLFYENIFGAQGVAAHPNLLVDLLLTMPWYTMMVLTFVSVQNRRRFSAAGVLFLGGVYEIGGDGFAGQVLAMLGGDYALFTPGYWLMIGLVFIWAFISVYSSMVLPSAWVIAETAPLEGPNSLPAWLDALKPLGWLPLFIIYLLVCLLLISALSPTGAA